MLPADARPVKVGLDGAITPGTAADSWLEFTGAYTPRTDADPVDGEPIPYVAIGSARAIPALKQRYET